MAAFQTINRAVPVSELYTDPHDVVHSMWGHFVSPHPSPVEMSRMM
jgi:hypothetical protein